MALKWGQDGGGAPCMEHGAKQPCGPATGASGQDANLQPLPNKNTLKAYREEFQRLIWSFGMQCSGQAELGMEAVRCPGVSQAISSSCRSNAHLEIIPLLPLARTCLV